MIRTQIQLSEEQMGALKRMAATRGVSVAELVRQAVDRIIASQSALGEAEKRARALDVIGRFRSGLSDVAERHDEYLAQAYGSENNRDEEASA